MSKMTVKEVVIISMPGATQSQIEQVGAAMSMVDMPNVPIYITKAVVKPVSPEDIMALRNDLNNLVDKLQGEKSQVSTRTPI